MEWKLAVELSLSVIIILFNFTAFYHITRRLKQRNSKPKLNIYISLTTSNILIAAITLVSSLLTYGNGDDAYTKDFNSLPVISFASQAAILHLIAITIAVFLKLQYHQPQRDPITRQQIKLMVLFIWVIMIPGSIAITVAIKRHHGKSVIDDVYMAIGIIISLSIVGLIAAQVYLAIILKRHKNQNHYNQVNGDPLTRYREDLIELKSSFLFLFVFLIGFFPMATQGWLQRSSVIVANILLLVKSASDPFVYYTEVILIKRLVDLSQRSMRYSMQEFSEPVPIAVIGREARYPTTEDM